jgi:kynurenine formamidase
VPQTTNASAGSIKPYGALPVPHLSKELLELVRTGKIYSLAVMFEEGIPVPEPMVSYSLSPRLRHGDLEDIAPASAAAESISMSTHVGTHIDALCHIGEHRDANGNPDPNGKVYLYADGGKSQAAEAAVTYQGQAHLSIAEMPPIVVRGVLLDVAAALGVDVLPDAYVITQDDIAQTLTKQGVEVQPNTAVLIRTGFYNHLRDRNPAYKNAIAGIGLEAAKFLHQQGMILAGADNMTVEALPPNDHPVHRYLLVHNGVTHLENLYLEAMAEDKSYEFLLIVTPLRLAGATASWVSPIAIA